MLFSHVKIQSLTSFTKGVLRIHLSVCRCLVSVGGNGGRSFHYSSFVKHSLHAVPGLFSQQTFKQKYPAA